MTYSEEALLEIFGTPAASSTAIVTWKASWRETKGRIRVESYTSAAKLLKENDIDPLMYQYAYDDGDPYIVFYNMPDEVFFKIHQHPA